MPEKRYKHLGTKEREIIEDGLGARRTVSAIAKEIGCSAATVTREIVRNRRDDRYRKSSAASWNNGIVCIHRKGCEVVGLCAHCTSKRSRSCASCTKGKCKDLCKAYEEELCLQIVSSPHVCNGCRASQGCRFHRYRYSAKYADLAAQSRSREAREGIDVTAQDLKRSEDIICAGIKKGQGIDHIFCAHKDELAFAKSSFYRHVKNGDVSILPIELRKAVKYKLRNKTDGPARTNIASDVLKGRTYDDFKGLGESTRARVVECDCIEGPSTENDAILTLHFKALHFQIAFKLDAKNADSVVSCFKWLADILECDFARCFGILLFDRGSEFARAADIEGLGDGVRCYFTDPQRANQKGACEKNHVEWRKVLAKGSSFAKVGPWELSEVMSHVNSSLREALFGKSPMEMAMTVLPKELFEHLGLRLIAPDDVTLLPRLLDEIKRPVR
jgi:IS30 family transposase